jgi:hypothetical protein
VNCGQGLAEFDLGQRYLPGVTHGPEVGEGFPVEGDRRPGITVRLCDAADPTVATPG